MRQTHQDEQLSQESVQEQIAVEEEQLRNSLKSVPYQIILKQRELLQSEQEKSKPLKKNKKIAKTNLMRERKGAPIQSSIHRRTNKLHKPIFESSRAKAIDPRFQSYAGNYNPDLAMKSFDFIPKIQEREIGELKSLLKSKKGKKLPAEERQVLKSGYNRLTSDHKRIQLVQLEKEAKREITVRERGYHPKEREIREKLQQKKLSKLSKAGQESRLKEQEAMKVKRQHAQKMKTLRNKY